MYNVVDVSRVQCNMLTQKCSALSLTQNTCLLTDDNKVIVRVFLSLVTLDVSESADSRRSKGSRSQSPTPTLRLGELLRRIPSRISFHGRRGKRLSAEAICDGPAMRKGDRRGWGK